MAVGLGAAVVLVEGIGTTTTVLVVATTGAAVVVLVVGVGTAVAALVAGTAASVFETSATTVPLKPAIMLELHMLGAVVHPVRRLATSET